MSKKAKKIIALCLCAALCLGGAGMAFAQNGNTEADDTAAAVPTAAQVQQKISKDEAVYVLADADGSVQKIIVSDWLKNELGSSSVTDKSSLSGITNVKGDESYSINGDNMTVWDAQGNDIYYQGSIEKELPVGLTVSYKLDGKSVSPAELAGKSGKVTIRFDYENRQYETVSINGVNQRIYVPFAMLTGMILDNDTFRNIQVSNGKLVNDGDRTVVAGLAFPGLQENLNLSRSQLSIPDSVEITADVTNFSLGMTVTLACNDVFNRLGDVDVSSLDSVSESMGQLTDAMEQLLNGSSALYDGLSTLLDKSTELVSGVEQLAQGAAAIKAGADSLDEGAAALKAGLAELSTGLNELSANSATLNGGAKTVFESLLATATAQIKESGLSVPALTIENYAQVLGELIQSLDKDEVYAKALKTVTDGVEKKVTEQVIQAATGQVMSYEEYEAAVAAGLIPQATQEAIHAAVSAQMQTAEVQAAISAAMASDEVQAQLNKAAAGAQTLIGVKTSLDSYNTFYLGLLEYTAGVDKAADGSDELYAGVGTLKDGTAALKVGAAQLYSGVLQLKDSSPALVSGVQQLKDGSMQLSEGLQQLNREGIEKLVSLLKNDVGDLGARIKATVDVSNDYRSFSGVADGTDGQVKFIYRTEEIEAE